MADDLEAPPKPKQRRAPPAVSPWLTGGLVVVILALCAAVGAVGYQVLILTERTKKLEDALASMKQQQQETFAKQSEVLRQQEASVVQRLNALAAAREVKRVQQEAETPAAEAPKKAKAKAEEKEEDGEAAEEEEEEGKKKGKRKKAKRRGNKG